MALRGLKALKTCMKSLKPLDTSKIYLCTLLNASQCFVQAFSYDLFHDQYVKKSIFWEEFNKSESPWIVKNYFFYTFGELVENLLSLKSSQQNGRDLKGWWAEFMQFFYWLTRLDSRVLLKDRTIMTAF